MSQFLRLRKEFFTIDDAVTYQLVTVQLHARGIRERQQLTGAEIKTKRQQRIQSGDLLVAEIDAKVGGFGVVPAELEGAIVSSHYFLYEIDTNQADPRYLEYYLQSGQPEQDVQQFVKGSVNYAAIRPHHFPQLHIPLPPMAEQRRIVARIKAITDKVAEASIFQREARQEAHGLRLSTITKILSPYQRRTTIKSCLKEPLRNGLSLSAGDIFAGDSSEGIGIPFLKLGAVSFEQFDPSQVKLVDIELPDDSPFWVQPGDLLMGRGNSLELVGRAALYTGEPHRFAYPDLIIRIRLNTSLVIPQFVAWFLRSREARDFIERRVVGTSPTMKKVSQPLVEQIPVPEMRIEDQQRIVGVLDRVQQQIDGIVQAQVSTQAELTALLPAVLDKAFRGEL